MNQAIEGMAHEALSAALAGDSVRLDGVIGRLTYRQRGQLAIACAEVENVCQVEDQARRELTSLRREDDEE